MRNRCSFSTNTTSQKGKRSGCGREEEKKGRKERERKLAGVEGDEHKASALSLAQPPFSLPSPQHPFSLLSLLEQFATPLVSCGCWVLFNTHKPQHTSQTETEWLPSLLRLHLHLHLRAAQATPLFRVCGWWCFSLPLCKALEVHADGLLHHAQKCAHPLPCLRA